MKALYGSSSGSGRRPDHVRIGGRKRRLGQLVEAVEHGQRLVQQGLDLGHLGVGRLHVFHRGELADLVRTRPADEAAEPLPAMLPPTS